MTRPPLSGLKVLELGELIAGPFVGTLLGEFGAEVIKIERPGRGDVLRQFGPMVKGESLYWAVNGRNKKSVVLDLKKAAGRTVLGELIARCDVLVNSLRPGTLESWGFTEEVLKTSFPTLVLVHASAFGRTGPKASQGGYDPVAQGFSGLEQSDRGCRRAADAGRRRHSSMRLHDRSDRNARRGSVSLRTRSTPGRMWSER